MFSFVSTALAQGPVDAPHRPVKSTALICDWPAYWRLNAIRTARERARAELTRRSRTRPADSSGRGRRRLSLRAVARELGMVSSALYRYFPSRDDLLTALIIDAYDALGEAAEAAHRGRRLRTRRSAGSRCAGGAGLGAGATRTSTR